MKRIISILTVVVVMLNFVTLTKSQTVKAVSFLPPEQLYSDSAILYNLDTQTIVYERKPDTKCFPAQLTQIMTAIVAIEKAPSLDSVIECPPTIFEEFEEYRAKYSDEDSYNEVTTCGIESGEQLKIEHLIYAMLLKSSCEAASTIAYNIGQGSIQNFVNMMNEKAKAIGAENTHFTNPHGLYDEGQYSTASDLLKITEYALSLPGFSEIAGTYSYSTGPTNIHSEGIEMNNVNLMMNPESMYYYEHCKGIKTGNSDQSGRCLISKASHDGQNYIAVLLGSPFMLDDDGDYKFTHLIDAKKIFEWAFKYIEHKVVLDAAKEVSTLKINYAKGKEYINLKPVSNVKCMWDKTKDISLIDTTDIEYVYEELNAPVKAGEKLGTLKLTYLKEEIGRVDLVAYSDAELSYVKCSMAILDSYFTSSAFKTAIRVATGLSIIYLVIAVYTINLRAKRRREKRRAKNRQE